MWASIIPAIIYLLKVINRNARKKCEIYSKLTIKYQGNVTDVILVFLLLTLNIFHTFSSVSIADNLMLTRMLS